jgi:hypothetical protein
MDSARKRMGSVGAKLCWGEEGRHRGRGRSSVSQRTHSAMCKSQYR